jgi:hypothetical protein
LQNNNTDAIQGAIVEHPIPLSLKEADKNLIAATQEGLRFERVEPAAQLVYGGLKLTDHIGNSN